MILYATIAALTVLCVLLWYWGYGWKERALYNQRAAKRARIETLEAVRESNRWQARAERLKSIVDRVEG